MCVNLAACKYACVCIRMCVHECVQVFLSFRVSVWAVYQRTNRVTRLESSFSSLLSIFSSLWSSLGLRVLISYAGLSLIYVLCGLKWGSADVLWSQSHAALCTAPNWSKCPKSPALCSHQSVWEKHRSLSPCVFLSVPLLLCISSLGFEMWCIMFLYWFHNLLEKICWN